jgi:hypothetical protein
MIQPPWCVSWEGVQTVEPSGHFAGAASGESVMPVASAVPALTDTVVKMMNAFNRVISAMVMTSMPLAGKAIERPRFTYALLDNGELVGGCRDDSCYRRRAAFLAVLSVQIELTNMRIWRSRVRDSNNSLVSTIRGNFVLLVP